MIAVTKKITDYIEYERLLLISENLKDIVENIDLQKYIDANAEVNLYDHTVDEPINVLEDLSVNDAVDVNFAIFYDVNKWLIPDISKNTFKKIIEELDKLPGILRAQVLRVGPNSIVPEHDHPLNLKMYKDLYHPEMTIPEDVFYEEINLNHEPRFYSTIIGLNVPSIKTEELGLEVADIKMNNETPIIFDVRIPHRAWNKTDRSWISMIMFIEREYFK